MTDVSDVAQIEAMVDKGEGDFSAGSTSWSTTAGWTGTTLALGRDRG